MNEFDHTKNFWKLYPQFKTPFFELYNNDRSKGKHNSSMWMWAIAYAYHHNSPYSKMLEEDKKLYVERDLSLSTRFSWQNVKDLSDKFRLITSDKSHKFLEIWEKEIEDLFKFCEEIPFSINTPVELIELKLKMMDKLDKIWGQYDKRRKAVEAAEFKSAGDEHLSLSDKEII